MIKIREMLIKYRGSKSQEEMANKYNVTQQTWSNWERGKKTPSPAIMKQIEIDSGFPMEEIFADVFNNHKLLKSNSFTETTANKKAV